MWILSQCHSGVELIICGIFVIVVLKQNWFKREINCVQNYSIGCITFFFKFKKSLPVCIYTMNTDHKMLLFYCI